MQIAGKTALITGAGRRLGRALSLGLSQAGAAVAVHYRTSKQEAEELVNDIESNGGRALSFAADLGDPDAPAPLFDRIMKALGPVHILVNNASRFAPNSVETADHEAWQADWMIHAEAPALLARELQRRLPPEETGRIVNLLDWRASIPDPAYATYCVTKSTLFSLTRYLARALAPRITVNAIAPGAILPPSHTTPKRGGEAANRVPLGRVGHPEDIVRTALYLIRDADYTTGAVIPVDGGRHLQ